MAVIVTIIPYHFYPPVNGGSLRCFHLIRELALRHTVHVLTIQHKDDFKITENHPIPTGVTIHSIGNKVTFRSIFNLAPRWLSNLLNSMYLKRSLVQGADVLLLQTYRLLIDTLQLVSPHIIVYENLEAVNAFSTIVRRKMPSIKQVYDAHNVDSTLWDQLAIATGEAKYKQYAKSALKVEMSLYKRVHMVLCCSQHDKRVLLQLNTSKIKVSVVPNGVQAFNNLNENLEAGNGTILFCGNLNYFPNEEGLIWFYKNVYTQVKSELPLVKLCILGTDRKDIKNKEIINDSSIVISGKVPQVHNCYSEAAICIAPLFTGSGTRLKILEAMKFGKPVVATGIGAEGLEVENGNHLLLADTPQAFVSCIVDLYKNKSLYTKVSIAAQKLVQAKYDWSVIGIELEKVLTSKLN